MSNLPKKPNILILLTDQDTTTLEWLPEFEEQHLPTMKRLKKNGLTFKNMFTAAAACSPSRATMLTSTYPTENGVTNTIVAAEDYLLDPAKPIGFSQTMLRPSQLNLAHILQNAGYTVVWKGKWHLSYPVNGISQWSPGDIAYFTKAYGFDEWNPSDAGDSMTDFHKLGGGKADNDGRFTRDSNVTWGVEGTKGAVEFIKNYKKEDSPFCLIVSLVNPHDINVAPTFPEEAGYEEENIPDYKLNPPIPENVNDDLIMKPDIQLAWREIMAASDNEEKPICEPEYQRKYVNFYAHLKKLVDEQMGEVLQELDDQGLTDETVIVRISDHGEMSLHHGMREKMFNAYEQTIKVHLIFSNPLLFPEAKETDALASTIDLVPTLAKIAGVYDQYKFAFKGCDLTPLFDHPEREVREYSIDKPQGEVRQYIHFTTDEDFLPQEYKFIPQRIRAIRSHDWKYAVYFLSDGSQFEFELYNLNDDPNENNNLAGVHEYIDEQKRLHQDLQDIMLKMNTLPTPFWFITKEMADNGVIPPVHWPTPDEAVEEAIGQHASQHYERQLKHREPKYADYQQQIQPRSGLSTSSPISRSTLTPTPTSKELELAHKAKKVRGRVWWVRAD